MKEYATARKDDIIFLAQAAILFSIVVLSSYLT